MFYVPNSCCWHHWHRSLLQCDWRPGWNKSHFLKLKTKTWQKKRHEFQPNWCQFNFPFWRNFEFLQRGEVKRKIVFRPERSKNGAPVKVSLRWLGVSGGVCVCVTPESRMSCCFVLPVDDGDLNADATTGGVKLGKIVRWMIRSQSKSDEQQQCKTIDFGKLLLICLMGGNRLGEGRFPWIYTWIFLFLCSDSK